MLQAQARFTLNSKCTHVTLTHRVDLYRAAEHLESYIQLQSIWGVPLAWPAWAVASCSSGPPAGELPKLIAIEYRNQGDGSPCTSFCGPCSSYILSPLMTLLFSVAFSRVCRAESPGLLCVLLPPSDPLWRGVPLHRRVRGLRQTLQGGDAQLRGLLEPLEGRH